MLSQEFQDFFSQEAAVRGDRELDLSPMSSRESIHMLDGPPDQVKRQKRLAAVETDDAFPGKKGMEEIDRPRQGWKIQALLPLFLITIGTFEIALIRHDDRKTLKLQAIDGAFPEKSRTKDRLSPDFFPCLRAFSAG
jgi:hypothetical protein